ncbi:MAG: NADH:ubiquinone reductase (Na(+)-transporting) subunit C [Desulfuromonadaceae bacterium]|nr:NADH:ubiquinone reductase (Na(+)-transporting) subunit C [Desulfuromonadaceae bacterium]
MSNDSILKTFLVTFSLCVVCSVLVCMAALVRIDREAYNQLLETRTTVLAAGGYDDQLAKGASADELFANFEMKVINLDTGEIATEIDPAEFNPKTVMDNPDTVVAIPAAFDIASIKQRPKFVRVFIDNSKEQIVVPVSGPGMWGTMAAYIGVKNDGTTVNGLKFYQHSETPGLGSEIERPKFQNQWIGKKLYGNSGNLTIKVVKNGRFDPNGADAVHTIDGLAGATVTGDKVQAMVQYWFSDHGYGKFLAKYTKSKE